MSVQTLQAQWQAAVRFSDPNPQFNLLSVCGPSGSGKTTVCRALARFSQVYLEDVGNNPHLKPLLERTGHYDAAANQSWFIDRILQFVEFAGAGNLVLDQDPAAILFAYTKMFHEEGGLASSDFEWLIKKLLQIELKLRRWRSPRSVPVLYAPAETLRDRVIRRKGGMPVPPLDWFRKVSNYFDALANQIPNVTRLSTTERNIEETVAVARTLLKVSIP